MERAADVADLQNLIAGTVENPHRSRSEARELGIRAHPEMELGAQCWAAWVRKVSPRGAATQTCRTKVICAHEREGTRAAQQARRGYVSNRREGGSHRSLRP
eukprot:1075645-Prymnesium_polylepis.1